MTRDETKDILMKIDGLFPNWKPGNLTVLLDTWAVVLGNYTKQQVDAALIAYISGDTSGFAPSPGQLLGIIRTASENPMDTLTPLEAWGLVYKAICNSGYHAEEEFNRLPEICQKAVGSSHNLAEMAAMDTATVQSVEQSHFIREYESLRRQVEKREQIPESVRAAIGTAETQGIESGENTDEMRVI